MLRPRARGVGMWETTRTRAGPWNQRTQRSVPIVDVPIEYCPLIAIGRDGDPLKHGHTNNVLDHPAPKLCASHVITPGQLIAHAVGDYIFQSDWMANNKTKRSWPAAIHATTYAVSFLPFRPSPAAFSI